MIKSKLKYLYLVREDAVLHILGTSKSPKFKPPLCQFSSEAKFESDV